MTAAFERTEPGSELPIARLGFELLRPVPFAPLELSIRIVRAGRRVQELAGELRCGEDLICRANALRVKEVPADLPVEPPAASVDGQMPGPEDGEAVRFALDDPDRASFAASGMEMRWLDDPRALGEWIGLDARTLLHGGGTGLAESVLHDVHGAVGRAFQTLVVEPR
jgi:hypothetical protein